MASPSSSKGFDFASNDILCSYEDYGNQIAVNGAQSGSAIVVDSNKMVRSDLNNPDRVHGLMDESLNREMMVTMERIMEKTMKRYSENVMKFLEGLSSRLSQLELYCYNVDKSVGELRSDLVHDHGEQDLKLESLDKHLQEVHRSVQILRDKQELADTQKELAELHLAHRQSSNKDQPPPKVHSPEPGPLPNLQQSQPLTLAIAHQTNQHQHQSIPPPQPQTYYLPSQPIHSQFISSSQWSTPQQIITTPHLIKPQALNNHPVYTQSIDPRSQSMPPNTFVIYESNGNGPCTAYHRSSQPTHFQNQMIPSPQFVPTHIMEKTLVDFNGVHDRLNNGQQLKGGGGGGGWTG